MASKSTAQVGVPSTPSVPAPPAASSVTTASSLVSFLGGVIGKTADGKDLGLSPATASFFGLVSPHLILSSDERFKNFETWPIVPVGQPVGLTALLPPVGATELLTTATGKESTLKYQVPAEVKWKVQFFDVDKRTTGESASVIKTLTDTSSHQASTTFDDTNGTHQILNGDLSSLQLNVLPWPHHAEASNGATDYSKMRIMKISLEVTVLLPGKAQTTFALPDSLYGIIAGWDSVFGASGIVEPSGSILTRTAGKSDPLAAFRNMFTLTISNTTPDVGEPIAIILKPQDQLSKIPMALSEVVDQKPEVKINAAIDFGAILQGIKSGIEDLFHTGSPSPELTDVEMSVGKILSSILSIPIAVKLDGLNSTKVLKPAAPLPIPSVTSIADTLLTQASIPIGNLNVLSQINAEKLKLNHVPNGNRVVPAYDFKPVSGLLGGKLRIVPEFTSLTDGPLSLDFAITIPTDVRLPGRKTPLSLTLPPLPVKLTLPTIPLPQVAVFTRAGLDWASSNVSAEKEKTRKPYFGDVLIDMCPQTRRSIPDFDMLKSILSKQVQQLETVLRIFAPPGIELSKWLPKVGFHDVRNLVSQSKRLLDIINNPKNTLYELDLPEWWKDADQESNLADVKTGPDPDDKKKTPWFALDSGSTTGGKEENITGAIWIGPPRNVRSFTLVTTNMSGGQVIWSPFGFNDLAIVKNFNEKTNGQWVREYRDNQVLVRSISLDGIDFPFSDLVKQVKWKFKLSDEQILTGNNWL